jgi:CPA2 family monovalent cation:H+ antiporter-2
VVRDPLPVLATVFIIMVGKSVAAYVIVRAFRRPVATALTISASLAQIGEFSFILAALGVSLAILPAAGQDLVLAGALISIVLNPLAFYAVELMRPWLEARRRPAEALPAEPAAQPAEPNGPQGAEPAAAPAPPRPAEEEQVVPTALSDHIVLVGYGRVGSTIAQGLTAAGSPFVVVEDAEERVALARAAGIEVVAGNAAGPQTLMLANIAHADTVVVAIPNDFEAGTVVEISRRQNAAIRIVARAHSDEVDDYLRRLGADVVILGEREIGLGMLVALDLGGGPRAGTEPRPAPARDEQPDPELEINPR